MRELPEQFGPLYPVELGATVAKFRRKARKGLSKLTCDERRAYGNAVHAAILRKQRSEFMRAAVEPGTRTEPIGAARRAAMRARLLACPSQVRRSRTDTQWRAMYEAAMREKRERIKRAPATVARRKAKCERVRERAVAA